MASGFDVHVDSQTLRRGERGAITGTLAVRVGDIWFPEATWNDFAVVVLARWCSEAAALEAGSACRLDFMDGDCRLFVRPSMAGMAEVEGVRGSATILDPQEAQVRAIIDSIHAAGRAVLQACVNHGWSSSDVDELLTGLGDPGHRTRR